MIPGVAVFWPDALLTGLATVFSWPGILIPVAGTLLVMVTSFLPGIGNSSLVVLLLVLTMNWDVESVLLLFGALTGGATFMGSITSILFNIPGNVSSAATLLDGYPLGKMGLPKMAIACSATASAVGSVFGVVILLLVLPVVQPLLLQFGPFERLLIGIWGLTAVMSVPYTSHLKALAMVVLGLLAAMLGSDPETGLQRWGFGAVEMSKGLGVVPVLLGLFTFSELIELVRNYRLDQPQALPGKPEDSVLRGIRSVFSHFGLTLRSSAIGTLIGMIPGVGGTVASFVAYGQAIQTSRGDAETFGKGDVRGLIAPEAAVDAKDGGSLLPVIAFGLPGSESGILLLTVITIHGLVPGVPMLTEQLPLTYALIFALLFSNILTSLVGVALAPSLARLKSLPIERLFLPLFLLSLLSVVQIDGYLSDLYTAVGFGIVGYFLKRHDWPRIPFIIAFVLGGFIETNLTLSAQLWEAGRIVPAERIGALVLMGIIVVSLLFMRIKKQKARKMHRDHVADVCMAFLLSAVSCAMWVAALIGGSAYSMTAKILVTLSLAINLAVLTRAAIWVRWGNTLPEESGTSGPPPVFLPEEHRLPLAMLLLVAGVTPLCGLPLALGASVVLWVLARQKQAGRYLRAALLGGAVAWAGHYFIHEMAYLILPQGILWTWLS